MRIQLRCGCMPLMKPRRALALTMLPLSLLLLVGAAIICVLGGDALLVGGVGLMRRSRDGEAIIVGGGLLVVGLLIGVIGYRLYRRSLVTIKSQQE